MTSPGVYRSLDRAREGLDAPVVTIGNFDGVHVGHRAIFERARTLSTDTSTETCALTFSPHPVRYFRPDADPFRLTSDERKFELIQQSGVDAILALPFDENVANLSPDSFVRKILANGLGATHVVVGENFAFGKNRSGTTEDLRRLADEHGIDTKVLEKVRRGGEVVSSTRIREALEEADVGLASKLLDRRYRLEGTVITGDGRGSDLGYPTANLDPGTLVPGDGIYASRLHRSDGQTLPAATSIGTRPTFNDAGRAVEAYVLDRNDLSLYDEFVELEFVEFVRPEEEFESSAALVEQMDRDVERVRSILESEA